jgi:hypothetical protein
MNEIALEFNLRKRRMINMLKNKEYFSHFDFQTNTLNFIKKIDIIKLKTKSMNISKTLIKLKRYLIIND